MAEGVLVARDDERGKFYRELRDRLTDRVTAETRLHARRPDGTTLADHLRAAQQATGQRPAELDIPEIPLACVALYRLWRDLSETRPSGFGHGAISYTEIHAWQQLHGLALTGWEIDTLRAMDRAELGARAQQQQEHPPRSQYGHRNRQSRR